ncbi:Rv1535 domain-containing protein [Mycolicibacterium sp. P1-5]|uniref:Rv1535 domain-containing protein n=1 Tax=Mycolicibacterium sp. P1-5 TaxID=2024617 RepID=UPI0026575549|nr:Rv1535 domain-containing protein [Mycolicibacterium sp. P1-5]
MVSLADGVGSDPLPVALARLLVVPLREVYALLWRVGVVHVVDGSSDPNVGTGNSRDAKAAPAVAQAAEPRA